MAQITIQPTPTSFFIPPLVQGDAEYKGHGPVTYLRVDLQVLTRGQNQNTSIGACVLDGCAHETVDQFVENYFAGDGLRNTDHRREIQNFYSRQNCARRTWSRLVPFQVWVQVVELPDFAIRSPTEITVPGFAQIRIREVVESSCRIKARGNLVGNRLVVDEPVRVRGADSFFIEAHGIEVAALYSRDFRTHERRTVLEILRAVL